eukprot:CAMPEP_0195121682 /NCGR_PEP_ID=MMETSP0448-20130528/124777_1 /TAXON_ID=66468 /ORGANISM="Heterocapsa triquestra, Strain CCMP 448" /LENGTH=174 /DNA_ID=CAMNT_0040159155 /DNA_START=11 /DNA_END=532 /DNA_ORIENTATION=+
MMGVHPVKKPGAKLGETVDDYWAAAFQHLLKDPRKLLEDMLLFDRDQIEEETIQRITPLLSREDFEPANVKKTSHACEAICRWVRSMVKYHHIQKTVQPKREKLEQITLDYTKSKAKLDEAQARLEDAQAQVEKIERELQALNNEEDTLSREIMQAEARRERAQRLMGSLGSQQ